MTDSTIPLPPSVAAAVWRGNQIVHTRLASAPTGWDALDAELPGQGWPRQSLVEILQAQPGQLEWRLTAAALQQQSAQRQPIIVLGAPQPPHASGLAQQGINPEQLVWIQASSPQERLWALEQIIRANCAGALLAWLPQAQPEQIRRLQISAQQFQGLAFVFRPDSCLRQASAAPLRISARCGALWSLQVHIAKRRGPQHTGLLDLPAVPASLQAVLTPRMLQTPVPAPTTATPPNPTVPHHEKPLGRPAAPLPVYARHTDIASATIG